MPQKLEVDREVVKQLVIQGLKTSEIAAKTGVKSKTIQTWSLRYGWGQLATKTRQILEEAGTTAMTVSIAGDIAEQSRLIRSKLSSELASQVALLEQSPPKRISELGNTPEGQGRAQVVKTIADAASAVLGWDNEKSAGLVVMGDLNVLGRDREARLDKSIDVEEIKPE